MAGGDFINLADDSDDSDDVQIIDARRRAEEPHQNLAPPPRRAPREAARVAARRRASRNDAF